VVYARNTTMTRAGYALVVLALASCGDEEIPDTIEPEEVYAGRCETPRKGTDPSTGDPFRDVKGSTLVEKLWVRSWIDDLYLWYSEVPDVDLRDFDSATDYFDVMKTEARTPSGKLKDEFHFWINTEEWVSQSQSGVSAGYGAQWVLLSRSPPRKLVVAYVEPESPAALAGIERGTAVLTIDGVDLEFSNDVDALNAGLFPTRLDEPHLFSILDRGATVPRTVEMMSASITSAPVQSVQVLPTDTGMVGYLVFNDHIATAEKALFDAFTQLRAAQVTDLVIDMRYNGGGYLAIAAQLAHMIGGPDRTSGKVFERELFNDKYTDTDPFTGGPIEGIPFVDRTIGFSLAEGMPLPTLGLGRVFVITGSGTCSASEAVMNGLAGVDIEVIQVGATTCGKPYGFFPADNCGNTYFAIQFQGVNHKGFGEYADGFAPGGLLKGCAVADDFTHVLGDPAEGRLAVALAYRTNQTCPTARLAPGADPLAAAEGTVLKPVWLQNRIMSERR
jgi:carboxyl-terminal processing protease